MQFASVNFVSVEKFRNEIGAILAKRYPVDADLVSEIPNSGIGYAIGEVVSLSANRKRGRGLQAIAGLSMVVSYVVRSLLNTPLPNFMDSFLNVYGLIALVLGIIVAVSRLRGN